jgi:hypothetical protein
MVDMQTWARESVVTYQLIITAGEEKLEASTGAGVGTGSMASSTGSVTSATESVGSSPEEATGVAAPMKTVAPALVGVGALAAAIFL